LLDRVAGAYSNTLDTAYFLDKTRSTYTGGILEMCSVRLYRLWGSLTESLRTGLPQNEAGADGNMFETLYRSPEHLEPFLSSMTGYTHASATALAVKFPWSKYGTFADIGAAQGAAAVQIVLANSHLAGIGFDLPQVEPVFEKYVKSFGLTDRVQFVGGNFFTDPLPRADVLVMGNVLHDWNLDERRLLLSKAYQALPSGGALIVCETLIDDERRSHSVALLQTLNMGIETAGGANFTGAECRAWLREAGFRDSHVQHLTGEEWMVVATK
jgi:SAM-dependent methyltransferase